MISCDDPACARTRVEQPVEEREPWYGHRAPPRAAMVVRPDGRPLIAYREPADSAIKLLDCRTRTRTCAEADTTTLTAPGGRVLGLTMVLDRAGRALVAYQDLDRRRTMIATCTSTSCTQTPITTIPRDGGRGMTMTLDSNGRPMLAWVDFAAENDWDLIVTTPLN